MNSLNRLQTVLQKLLASSQAACTNSRIYTAILYILQRYNTINGQLLAKGLCYSLIIGLLPLLFVSFTVVAFVLDATPEFRAPLLDGLGAFIPLEILEDYINGLFEYSANWRSLSVITLAVFLLFAINLLNSLGRVLRTILSKEQADMKKNGPTSFVLLVVCLILFYVSILIHTEFGMLNDMSTGMLDDMADGMLDDMLNTMMPFFEISFWLRESLSVLAVAVVLLLLYYMYSNRKLHFGTTAVIAILCSLVWEIVGVLGSSIIQLMNNRLSIFGTMATPIIFLIYLRFFAEILIFSSIAVDYFNSHSQRVKINVDSEGAPSSA